VQKSAIFIRPVNYCWAYSRPGAICEDAKSAQSIIFVPDCFVKDEILCGILGICISILHFGQLAIYINYNWLTPCAIVSAEV
jgi:hypothetical protein